MAEKQIAGDNIAKKNRGNSLCQSGVTLIEISVSAVQGNVAGFPVALAASFQACRTAADEPAESGELCRTGCEFLKLFVKYSNADMSQCIEIIQ
jgi:hypothetical protein